MLSPRLSRRACGPEAAPRGHMRLFARVRSWLRASSRRADFEREMQDEMRVHLELYQADLRRRGLSDEEARRRARADFGSLPARQDECREAVGLRLLDELRGDVTYEWRGSTDVEGLAWLRTSSD